MSGVKDLFSGPKAAPAVTKDTPTPMPVEDERRMRLERLKSQREESESGGRTSTMMTGNRTGDMSRAEARGGFGKTMMTG